MSDILRTEGLSVNYGGVRALDSVDVAVPAGQLVGLIGPNGAGKTTFIDAITGFAPSTGDVRLNGESIAAILPHRRARHGIARTWQSTMLFDDLTVEENLAVASNATPWWRACADTLRGRSNATAHTRAVLDELELGDLAETEPAALTQGQRKLVGVARALAARPALLCLDEPAAGLDTAESRAFGRKLRAIVDRGTTILLIDHDMGLVLSICDEVVVLDFGKVIFSGPPPAVRTDARVVEAYLGASAKTAPLRDPETAPGGARA
jgi:branched-chain amino acid transport system ATP-binding protein